MDEVDPLTAPPATDATASGPWRMVTTWWASDPTVAKSLAWVNSLPQSDPLRHEAEAGIHVLQARWAWAEADRLRAQQASNQRREQRLAAGHAQDGRHVVRHGTCPNCQATVRLRSDGTVRVHDVGSGAAQSRSIHGAANRCVGAGLPPAT